MKISFEQLFKKTVKIFKNRKDTFYKKAKVTLIKLKLRILKNDIENMFEDEIRDKKLNLIVDLVEKILDTNEQLNMPDLESEESAEQRRGHSPRGLKILTPKQMISTLPISLARLKARNNSQKLENEIRQLLHSLYRSKNLSKTIYDNLINAL